ncbi:FAD binding domain-containing protein [Colletotrichum higginsianum IMI 349063]|uniref:FAD binding domain-containing protein n=1 Tax=Colletotrichum higginsianum (strain IMI 349063) TaxID=759273 RepID=A0A1B7XZU1_COLHI|nr:FAD binding domain-containing protein [Colletotrichum higginsianum IMI 349063]OBR05282.1 FAD binding domain-containing protein [Colletotrichum higginsianum IMI 349063]
MLEITQPPCPAGGHLQHGVDYAKHHLSPRSAPKKDISYEVPVLIVGGGPTGLLTAYMLSRHGVRSLLVEKYPERLAAPKAHALCPRTLEICRQYGLDTNTIRRMGSPRRDACRVNFLTNLGGEVIGSLPYERMDAGVLEHTPQPDFEKFVSDQLLDDPNVEIRKGVGFVSCEHRGGKVFTTVEERATNKRYTVTSRHLVGCDGAKSQVRRCLGIETEGEDGCEFVAISQLVVVVSRLALVTDDSDETMMTIHFNADLRPVVKNRVGMLHWIVDPACSGFIIAYDLGGNQVLISNFDSKKQPIETWNEERAHATVSAAIGQDIPIKVLSYRPWVLSRKVAKEYRRGNVFLVGDAAHSFPPTGGLGLNSGIADAHNLAYKIAAVHWGRAGPGLLDAYERERRQVAVVAAAQSIENGKSIFSFLKAVGAAGQGEDLAGARRRMYETIRDPAKQALIAENVERQREHFDNIELHIGYVYGDDKPPASTLIYTPKFRTGARLPHAWIRIKRPSHGLPQQPIDLSYVEELSDEQVAARQFSTLDLVQPGTFSLITGRRSAWARRSKESAEVLGYGISLCLWAADEDFAFCDEGHSRLFEQDGRLSHGGAILVRPDQHILECLGTETSVEEIVNCIARHMDVAI